MKHIIKLSCLLQINLICKNCNSFTIAPTKTNTCLQQEHDRKAVSALFGPPIRTFCVQKNRNIALFNVPPETLASTSNMDDIKSSADRQSPPQNFFELQQNCQRATELAISDGLKLLEIEFPPLPSSVLEMDDVSAYDIAMSNFKLAVDFSKSFASDDHKVAILLPDEAEKDIIVEKVGANVVMSNTNIEVSSLRRSEEGDTRVFKPEQVLLSLFGNTPGQVKALSNVKMYVIIVASAQELPDIEELHELDPNAVIVMFNMKLDTLRGDLGNPAFPSKDFHDRFLSLVKPVYYLRTRQYSRTTANPPFMVNFQGCLFRSYPGQYQTLLDTGNGQAYRRIQGNDIRPSLGGFKEQLTKSLQDAGVIPEENNILNFLRTGYKTATWWEEEREEASDCWRT